MKHIKLYEDFANESAKVGSHAIKIGSILKFRDGETWKVTKFIGSPSNPRGVFALPYGETKDSYVSIALEFKMDELEEMIESIDESITNEAYIPAGIVKQLADEINGELYSATMKGKSVTVKATTTTKVFDDGIPVLKDLARGKSKSIQFEPANPNVMIAHDYANGWWYFTDYRKWYGLHVEDGYNEISDLPFTNVKVTESVVNEAKQLNRDEFMALLDQKYGFNFVRTTEEFDGSNGGVWVSGENSESLGGKRIYNYYGGTGAAYELGVLKRFETAINKLGWYSEWYDPGTVMIWPTN